MEQDLITLLLIEDNPGDADLIIEVLDEAQQSTDFEIVHCEMLADGLSILAQRDIDVILSDLSLPDSQGIATYEELHHRFPHIPVVMLTGLDDENMALQAMQAGAQDYLVKGNVQGEAIARAIRYAIERSRLAIELENKSRELQDSETRLRRIIENNVDGIIILDHSDVVVFVNPAAEQLFGQQKAKIVGQGFPYLFNNNDTESTNEIIWSGRKPGEVITTEVRLADIEWEGQPARLASLRDISERKRAETATLRREEILEAVSMSADSFLHALDWRESIQDVLTHLGWATKSSRVYIYENSETEGNPCQTCLMYEWVAHGITPQMDKTTSINVPFSETIFGLWEAPLRQGETISGDTDSFSARERTFLDAMDVYSILVVPIFVDQNWWGIIGFDQCDNKRTWLKAEITALKAAADIMGAAIQRYMDTQTLQHYTSRLEAIQEIDRAILAARSTESIALAALQRVQQLVPTRYTGVLLFDFTSNDTQMLAISSSNEMSASKIEQQSLGDYYVSGMLKGGNPYIVNDIEALEQQQLLDEVLLARNVIAYAIVPLMIQEVLIGGVVLGADDVGALKPEYLDIAREIANSLSVGIQNAQLLKSAQQRAEEAETLRQAASVVVSSLHQDEAVDRILEQLAQVVPYDSASVQLMRDGYMEVIGGRGSFDPESLIGKRYPVPGDNPNTIILDKRQTHIVNDPKTLFPGFFDDMDGNVESWLGAPMIFKGRLLGMLALASSLPNGFTEIHARLVTAFTDQVAVAIENARLFEEMQQQAITDSLTGISNRRHFFEMAENEFERSRRYHRSLSMIMLDIDHFKDVNDRHGHAVGDAVLQEIAAQCRDSLRLVDLLARYGGEEFVILLPETDLERCARVAERLRGRIAGTRIETPEAAITVTASLGIASLEGDKRITLAELLNQADQALYAAKQAGRNRVHVIGKG